MTLLSQLLADDPASPRLSVYDEASGARLDFSAQTLDNWTSKVGNLLLEEFDAQPGATRVELRLPSGWQAVALVLGALSAGCEVVLGEHGAPTEADVLFCSLDAADEDVPAAEAAGSELVVLTADPLGRGVEEIGEELPSLDAIDFGPTVRSYGDQFVEPCPTLAEAWAAHTNAPLPPAERYLCTGWSSTEELWSRVLGPLAAGGSVVIAAGLRPAEELERIARAEKVTARL
ncbi:TIGR03089 family protein [Corynebacterium uropygiale]|uniref:TIGR03089 family protein n=1 Tax=Corynebacterium uropygiale TaxID=1775911 RepID=A0A9X1QPI0_9CORY|nr:TIGR03089 family protein [Corynebacterium uropygiale]MCF4006047.1 TIGR03089 family protein [Corynebacterium uropygiale]